MKEFTSAEVRALKTIPPILDLQDLTTVLRISKSTSYKLLKELKAWKDEDGEWMILRDDLITWIEKNTDS